MNVSCSVAGHEGSPTALPPESERLTRESGASPMALESPLPVVPLQHAQPATSLSSTWPGTQQRLRQVIHLVGPPSGFVHLRPCWLVAHRRHSCGGDPQGSGANRKSRSETTQADLNLPMSSRFPAESSREVHARLPHSLGPPVLSQTPWKEHSFLKTLSAHVAIVRREEAICPSGAEISKYKIMLVTVSTSIRHTSPHGERES